MSDLRTVVNTLKDALETLDRYEGAFPDRDHVICELENVIDRVSDVLFEERKDTTRN